MTLSTSPRIRAPVSEDTSRLDDDEALRWLGPSAIEGTHEVREFETPAWAGRLYDIPDRDWVGGDSGGDAEARMSESLPALGGQELDSGYEHHLSTEEYVLTHGLSEAVNLVHSLVAGIMGPAAEVSLGFVTEPETGERELVVRTRYNLGADVEWGEIERRHLELLNRYATEVPGEARGRMVLLPEL